MVMIVHFKTYHNSNRLPDMIPSEITVDYRKNLIG